MGVIRRWRTSSQSPSHHVVQPSSHLTSLAQDGRGGAFLLEEGGAAGLDILDQFSQLLGSINSQQSTRLLGNNNNNFNNNNINFNNEQKTNNMTLGDLATLLRGSANILENNAPRLNNIVN